MREGENERVNENDRGGGKERKRATASVPDRPWRGVGDGVRDGKREGQGEYEGQRKGVGWRTDGGCRSSGGARRSTDAKARIEREGGTRGGQATGGEPSLRRSTKRGRLSRESDEDKRVCARAIRTETSETVGEQDVARDARLVVMW